MKKWIFSLLVLTFITGCNANNEATQPKDNQPQTITVKNSTLNSIDRKGGQRISKHLSQLASKIPDVNDATAVVIGNYAIVGINVDEDMDRSEVGSVKYSVTESLRRDPYGANAVVVADPDMTARLKEIQGDIKNGKPLQGIMNELADISGRLMPELPAEIIEPNNDHPMKDEKKKLNKNESENLNKEQRDQSKQHINNRKKDK